MKIHHMPVYKLPKGWKLRKPTTNESEAGNDPCMAWFKDIKTKFAGIRSTWSEMDATVPTEQLKAVFEKIIPDGLKPRLRFVGRGTTRVAFVSDSNVCFKFQYNDWKEQSRQEVAEALAWPDLACFPKLFDWSEDALCMAYEVAMEPTREQFVETFTQTPLWISEKLREYAVEGESRQLDMMLSAGILNRQQEKAFRDLMEFQKTMYGSQGKCLEDIDHADNWGMLYREGQPVLIITDFGV